jgi:hypothetical protein
MIWKLAAPALALATVGCVSMQRKAEVAMPTEIQAVYADTAVQVDGRLDDAVWARAPAYVLSLPLDRAADGRTPAEGGRARFAWNEEWFYMAIEFTDSDVVAEGTEDGEHHYKLGDLAELFLWPDAHSWYWELYVTPAGKYTAFFFPGPGRLGLPSGFTNHATLTVAAQTQGTLNDWTDVDRGWTAEMAVPVKALTQRGEAWGPGSPWRLLVGRYNYSAHLPALEYSSMPELSRTSFHLREEYGRLNLLPAAP